MITMKSSQSKVVLSDMVEKSKAECRGGVTESRMGKMSFSIPNVSIKIKARSCLVSWGRWPGSEVAEISDMIWRKNQWDLSTSWVGLIGCRYKWQASLLVSALIQKKGIKKVFWRWLRDFLMFSLRWWLDVHEMVWEKKRSGWKWRVCKNEPRHGSQFYASGKVTWNSQKQWKLRFGSKAKFKS